MRKPYRPMSKTEKRAAVRQMSKCVQPSGLLMGMGLRNRYAIYLRRAKYARADVKNKRLLITQRGRWAIESFQSGRI